MTKEEIIADERYHTCGRCKWEDIPYICHQCKWGEDTRKDLWELKEDAEESERMTILEKIKFEEDWLSEVNLTKQNIEIAFAGIRATVLEQTGWIPIKTRPLTEEEKEHYISIGWSEDSLEFIYDCPLPDDGQEVLITDSMGNVELDTFYSDDGCYFENNCDADEVIAWMPLPESYRGDKDGENNTDND